jgi:peptidoglycan-associated lipoprotein
MVVYYDFDKYNLVDDAKAALENNARLMKENDKIIVKIEGHCDERGTVEYNLSLGEKRAASARDYLIELGVGAGNIQIVSYGKSRPVDTRGNEAAWAKNRRAKFTIISQ